LLSSVPAGANINIFLEGGSVGSTLNFGGDLKVKANNSQFVIGDGDAYNTTGGCTPEQFAVITKQFIDVLSSSTIESPVKSDIADIVKKLEEQIKADKPDKTVISSLFDKATSIAKICTSAPAIMDMFNKVVTYAHHLLQ
jgi:hypothetical protein